MTNRVGNSDVNLIGNHLKLVEEACLDPALLNLKVRNFTFIRSNVSTRSAQNLKMQGKFIRDKKLETSMEKFGCKRPISWTQGCREGVS
jgi:hypothetical protein